MQRMSGVSGLTVREIKEITEIADKGDVDTALSSLEGLLRYKYSDLILLCSVAAAFVILLALSAMG